MLNAASKWGASRLSAPRKHSYIKRLLERVMGIEPTLSAWEAEVLPLNYTRLRKKSIHNERGVKPKALRSDAPRADLRHCGFAY